MAAQPSAASSRAKAMQASMSQPLPSTQSVADTRTHTGRSSANAARTSPNTSSAKRIRLASDPPYSSLRRLAMGERNWCSR